MPVRPVMNGEPRCLSVSEFDPAYLLNPQPIAAQATPYLARMVNRYMGTMENLLHYLKQSSVQAYRTARRTPHPTLGLIAQQWFVAFPLDNNLRILNAECSSNNVQTSRCSDFLEIQAQAKAILPHSLAKRASPVGTSKLNIV